MLIESAIGFYSLVPNKCRGTLINFLAIFLPLLFHTLRLLIIDQFPFSMGNVTKTSVYELKNDKFKKASKTIIIFIEATGIYSKIMDKIGE